MASSLLALPFSLCPQYTGFIHGLSETYKKTPVMAQLETKDPEPTSFLHTRSALPHKPTYATVKKDPCNYPGNKPGTIANPWSGLRPASCAVC